MPDLRLDGEDYEMLASFRFTLRCFPGVQRGCRAP